MIDIVREIEAIQREVGGGRIPAGEGRTVRLSATYDAPIDDVWDALTNPERIGRWFLPISGDYRLGGSYQFEGNAGGEIVACDRPNRLKVTWVYGEVTSPTPTSRRSSPAAPAGDGWTTRLELEHTAIVPEEMWAEYGPGAVGVGWDGGVLGLALHLRGGSVGDPDGVAGVRRRARVLHGEQRGLGRGEPGRGRRPGGRRARASRTRRRSTRPSRTRRTSDTGGGPQRPANSRVADRPGRC